MKMPRFAGTRVVAALLGALALPMCVMFLGETVHVAWSPAAQVQDEYHFGAAHYAGDWAYGSAGAYIAHGGLWSVRLAMAVACFWYYAARANGRALVIALVLVGLFLERRTG